MSLNLPETLTRLRANNRPTPYPADWHPILDKIMKTLNISMVWSNLKTVKANKGTSGVPMFYEERTIFLSPRAPRRYLPEWHDISHAIIGRSHLDKPNYGCESFEEAVSDQIEADTQAVQFFLLLRFFKDQKKVRKCYRSFGFVEENFHDACVRGRELFLEQIPEMAEEVS